ncbi:AAA family ATPase [Enterococcus hulanensis]|uniref:AAA family ATPase n=1 Tax=Enterococcus hulanensis TaxID=2559929 RepID=UPI00288E611C|nr:AAA family ATPase [Enterococcus hulanensis]MDT2661142.1 AAA family ATPase [Enterococcus hulanensis]
MFENFYGITIDGDMLDNPQQFSLFEMKKGQTYPSRLSIVYGKNGSGKSTITKGFQKLSGVDITSISEAASYDFDGAIIEDSEEQKQNTFVFNEEFVEKNVKIMKDGLDTIVMFGEQADLESQIESLGKKISQKQIDYQNQAKKCNEFQDPTNVLSPEFHSEKIDSSLRGDANWAGRDREIRGNRSNTRVNQTTVESIIKIAPSESHVDLNNEFEAKWKEYSHLTNEGKKIEGKVPDFNYEVDTYKICELLKKKIEKPVLSDREKRIMEMVLNGQQKRFEEIQTLFSNDKLKYCPSCLQPVSEEYKKELIESISIVLNKEVDIHKDELKSVKISPIELDLTAFSDLDKSLVDTCVGCIAKANEAVEECNSLIDSKINKAYRPIFTIISLSKVFKDVTSSLKKLEESRLEYNKKFDETGSLKDDLLLINQKIAYYEIIDDYRIYLKQNKAFSDEKEQLKKISEDREILQNQLSSLQDKQKSISIAVDYINKGLKYVFFSDQRLAINTADDKYVLSSHGKPVKPQDISCGERNILALCYFFTLTLNNLNENELYTREVFLVIDDPVSSFDLENKVGILSYLKSQLLSISLGNENSKIVIFSHDLSTVYDLTKIFQEIQTAVKNKNKEGKKNLTTLWTCLELDHFSLESFSYDKRNEYTTMLETIFNFAQSETNDENLAIGNIMRRVLESFSTFEYKKGIGEISCDREILDSMNNENYSQYFENLMYRLILNGESHAKDHIKSLQDLNFYATISNEEKRRTAKDVLCFINVLNPKHIASHLPNAVGEIDSWCSSIKK